MTGYDIVSGAIKTAIGAGDTACPTANIHTTYRSPQKTDYDTIFGLLGNQPDDDTKRFHGWMMRRTASPQQETLGFTGSQTLLNEYEDWRLLGFYSVNDEGNSEKTFQDIVDSVKGSLRSDSAILDLEGEYEIVVETVSMLNFDNTFIVGKYLVHLAEVVLRLRHSNVLV
jgi:hypothetical protein